MLQAWARGSSAPCKLLVPVSVIVACVDVSSCCCLSLVLLFLCSSDLLSSLRQQALGGCGFYPLPSPLRALFPGCSGLGAPLVSSSADFGEQDFGTGIVLHETICVGVCSGQKWGLGACGVTLLAGAAVHTVWSCFGMTDGVGGVAGPLIHKGRVRKPGCGHVLFPEVICAAGCLFSFAW